MTEDGSVRPDAQGECQDGSDRKAWLLSQRAAGKAEVLAQIVEQVPARRAAGRNRRVVTGLPQGCEMARKRAAIPEIGECNPRGVLG